MQEQKALVLFDGVCNLCEGSVQWILKRDLHNTFVFASLQDDQAIDVLKSYELQPELLESVVVIYQKKVYTQSTAALRIVRLLGFPYNLLLLGYVLPRNIRDYLYKLVARNRYRWFGRKESCWLPKPEWSKKFPKELVSWQRKI